MRETTGLIGAVWAFGGGGGESGMGDVSCSLLILTLKGILVAYSQLSLIIFALVGVKRLWNKHVILQISITFC